MSIAGLLLLGLGIANVYPVVASIAVGLLPGEAEVAILRLMFTGSSAILAAPFALGIFGDVLGIGNAFGVLVPISVAADRDRRRHATCKHTIAGTTGGAVACS